MKTTTSPSPAQTGLLPAGTIAVAGTNSSVSPLAYAMSRAMNGSSRFESGFTFCDQGIGRLGPLPAVISVHGVVAADERSDPARSELRELDLGHAQGFAGAFGWRISAVQKGMKIDILHAAFYRELDHRQDIVS